MGRLAEGKSPQIAQLRYWHKAMARMALVGKRPGEIARALGMTPGQVSRVFASPLFQAELERLEALDEFAAFDARKELKLRQPKALEVIDEVLGNESLPSTTRARVAFDVLDRTGVTKGEAPKELHLHQHLHQEVKKMTDEELAKEAAMLLEEGEG